MKDRSLIDGMLAMEISDSSLGLVLETKDQFDEIKRHFDDEATF